MRRLAWRVTAAVMALQVLSPALARAQIGEPIVEIVVEQEGEVVNDRLIDGLIETRVGEPLSMVDVRETIEHLMNLRRFEDVQPVAEPVEAGVRLRYRLLPLHPVDRIEFEGALGLSRGELARIVTDRFGRAPAAGRAVEAAETLRQAYRRRGYPSATVATRIEETHNPDRATMIFEVDAGPRARIADIQWIQVDRAEPSALIGRPDLQIGAPYDFERVERALRQWEEGMRAQGYYEARASHGANMAGDAYLTVSIARGPRVIVEFAGDPLPADERERLVPIREEASTDEDLLEDAKIAIEGYLQAQGYRDARADYTRDESVPGQLTVRFTITRGPRFVVDSVRITGQEALSVPELRELLQIDAGDPFVRSTIAARAAAIRSLYRTRGYTRPQVDIVEAVLPPARPGADERRVEVVVQIVEGPRTLVRAVTVDGNTVFDDAELDALSAPDPGSVYTQAEVARSVDRIELAYRDRGYESVVVRSNVLLVENETAADIRYTIIEGPQSIVDHIIIVGNDRTSSDTIMREVLLREGEPLGYSALVNSRARLAALGLFRRVDIEPLQHTGESRRDVLIQIEEAEPTTLGYGGGVEGGFRLRTGLDGRAEERFELAPRGFFEVGRRNLWGKNRSVNLFTRVSLRSTDVLVRQAAEPPSTEGDLGFNEFRVVGTFREPRLLDSPAELLVTGIVEQAVRTTFNFSRRIARAEAGWRLSPAYSLAGRYSFERTKLFDERFTEAETPLLIDRLFPEVRLSRFAGSIYRDTRDDLLDASRGAFLILDGDIAGRAIGSEVGFVKTYLQAATYHRLPGARRVVLALAGRLGVAHGFPREVPRRDPATGEPVTGFDGRPLVDVVQDLPASERFFAGGETSVRGFSLDRLGSAGTISPTGFPLGGNSVVVLNSELRVSLFGDLQAVGFLDAGNVFPRAGDLDLTALRPAAGAGLRYQSPVGPIRLDLGFNLDPRELAPGQRERRAVFHISLGQAF